MSRGQWQTLDDVEHHYVAASGARFHLAQLGPQQGPLVVLLHGFPQFWWTWRTVLPPLAAAGFRAVALDLRGCGESDKPPSGYDIPTLAADTIGVIRCLGTEPAVVVGQGLGALVAWAAAAYEPDVVRAVGYLASPAPGEALRHPRRVLSPLGRQRLRWLATLRSPERALAERGLGTKVLHEWSAIPWWREDPDAAAAFAAALRLPFAAQKSVAPLRWLARPKRRRDKRRFARQMSARAGKPVLHMVGELDPLLATPVRTIDPRDAPAGSQFRVAAGCGHFLTEEAPTELADQLISWLRHLP